MWATGFWSSPTRSKISFESEAGTFKNAYKFSAAKGAGNFDNYIINGRCSITDVNDAPENIQVSGNHIVNEEQAGINIGIVSLFDQDDDWWIDPLSGERPRIYTVETGLDGAMFTIAADGKTLKLKDTVKLDWEAITNIDSNNGMKYVDVMVKATDQGSYDQDGIPTGQDIKSSTQVIRVYVNNVGESNIPPTILAPTPVNAGTVDTDGKIKFNEMRARRRSST